MQVRAPAKPVVSRGELMPASAIRAGGPPLPEQILRRPPRPPPAGSDSSPAEKLAQNRSAPRSFRRPSSQRLTRAASEAGQQTGQSARARTCSLPPLRGRHQIERPLGETPPCHVEASRPQRREASNGPRKASAVDVSGGGNARTSCGNATVPSSSSSSAPPRNNSAGAYGSGKAPSTAAAPPSRRSAERSPTAASAGNSTAMDGMAVRRAGLPAALQEWKKRRGHPQEAPVFCISGAFPGIKKALLEHGWVENTDLASPLWNLKYAMLLKDIGELNELDDCQVINFFGRNSEISSKIGLCNNLYSSCTLSRLDVDSFLPRCYDLTSTAQIENFVQDFKATSCACILHRFVQDGGRTTEGGAASGFPRSAIRAALTVCERRCRSIDEALDDALLPLVTEEEWRMIELCSLKRPGHKLKPWKGRTSQALANASLSQDMQIDAPNFACADEAVELEPRGTEEAPGSDASDNEANASVEVGCDEQGVRSADDEALFAIAKDIVVQLRRLLPQFGLDGFQNIWVLKPAGKSRGRGIQLSARLEKILDVGVGRGIESRWIAQKYIENPQIIEQKKFDIRQWAVVTRWDPLAVWFYEDCYIRFSFADYDPSKLKNKYAHLTNNSISKHAKDFDEKQDDTMIDSDEYSDYLQSLGIERNGSVVKNPWQEIVQPKLKNMVLRSLESVQDVIQPRTNSFQLFGYDFMVSDDLEAWLIEVNSSPDLSYSTSTTRTLVKAMLDDLVRVVVDAEKFGLQADRPRRKWDKSKINTGRFVLLEPERRRREERFGKLRKAKGTGQLEVRGAGIKPRRPKKGEMPGDVPDTRVLDAHELLAQLPSEDPGSSISAACGGEAAATSEEEGSDGSSNA